MISETIRNRTHIYINILLKSNQIREILFSDRSRLVLKYFYVNLSIYIHFWFCKPHAEIFFGFKMQLWNRVVISHIKLTNNLIIFDANKHICKIIIIWCLMRILKLRIIYCEKFLLKNNFSDHPSEYWLSFLNYPVFYEKVQFRLYAHPLRFVHKMHWQTYTRIVNVSVFQ